MESDKTNQKHTKGGYCCKSVRTYNKYSRMERKSQEETKKYLIDLETGEALEKLDDKTSTGKTRPWTQHKRENGAVERAYRDIAGTATDGTYWQKKADRLASCGCHLTFNVYATEDGETMKIKHAESCRVRLCPLCAWRRSMKIQVHMRKILEQLQAEDKHAYLLLTLTVPNVTAGELDEKIGEMMQAWQRLTQRKQIRQAVKGWYRGLEITHNVTKDTYHPHFHCLLAVSKKYFKGQDYIRREAWLELWQQAMRDDRITQVDIRRVKPKKGNDITGAVCEVAKYTVKAGDYILPTDWQLTLQTVATLDKVLIKRRLVAFGGILKEWHKRLNLDDEIDGDLIASTTEDNGDFLREVSAVWHVGYQQYIMAD